MSVAVVVAAAVVAMPTLLVRFTPVPIDQRVKGNWNMIRRVEPPPGWEVRQRGATPDFEMTTVAGPPTSDGGNGCDVTVYAAGAEDPTANRPDRTPVTVRGQPGFWAGRPSTAGDLLTDGPILAWEYRPGVFARVYCGRKSRAVHLDVAERVRFESVPITLPFRLRSVPSGYEVGGVEAPLTSSERTFFGGLGLEATEDGREPDAIGLFFQPGWRDPPPEQGWESETIAGRPALLEPSDGVLCLKVEQAAACLLAVPGGPHQSGLGWSPGHREALVELAERLVFTEDLDDRDTWFPANQAVPV